MCLGRNFVINRGKGNVGRRREALLPSSSSLLPRTRGAVNFAAASAAEAISVFLWRAEDQYFIPSHVHERGEHITFEAYTRERETAP